MRVSICLCALFLSYNGLKAQTLDKSLLKHQQFFFNFLKKQRAIDDTSTKFSEVKELMYSRELNNFLNKKVIYYEMGLTVSHGYKYLGILQNGKLHILLTKKFADEFIDIINPLKKINKFIKTDEVLKCLIQIKDLYDHNLNPSWKKEY